MGQKVSAGKRLESEILRGSKIKSPEITGLFILKMVVLTAHKIEPYGLPQTIVFPLYFQ
jgi:hypothetical protein